MQEQLLERLKKLTAEFKMGHNQLMELEGQARILRQNLLRMSGAIQVLEEEIAKEKGEMQPPAAKATSSVTDKISLDEEVSVKATGTA